MEILFDIIFCHQERVSLQLHAWHCTITADFKAYDAEISGI